MKVVIKYHESTSGENQIFTLDTSVHYQCKFLVDHRLTDTYNEFEHYNNEVDLSKYNGLQFYGTFFNYSCIDGYSMFIIDTSLEEIRDIKIKQLLQ